MPSTPVRINHLAMASVISAAICIIFFTVGSVVGFIYPPAEGHHSPLYSPAAFFIMVTTGVGWLAAPTAVVLGIVSLVLLRGRPHTKKETIYSWIGIVVGSIPYAFVLFALLLVLFAARHPLFPTTAAMDRLTAGRIRWRLMGRLIGGAPPN